MQDKTPRVFISYSWTSAEKVLELAERLMSCGVEVLLDKWDLKEGQDKYAFMERCVTDPKIDKVLLICDKAYAEKADTRSGGVGDETVIISSEVYGKVAQEKFIPIIIEVDECGKPYLPVYLESRIYIDLSTEDDRYEAEYEKLLRNIHDKPLYKKPALGKVPEWLEDDTINLSPIRGLIKQTRGYTGGNKTKADYLLRNTISAFLTALLDLRKTDKSVNDELLLAKIDQMKPLRDLYADFIEAVIYSGLPVSDTITSFFEQVYNSTHDASGRGSYSDSDFEYYDFFIWESFIASTAILLHYEKFKELHDVLCHTYFLREDYFEGANIKENNYSSFRKYARVIEEVCKPKCDEPRLYTLAGRMLIQREKKPILTDKALANADVVLYQLFDVLEFTKSGYDCWFPTSYAYCKDGRTMWTRLKSRKYCQKVLPLFGVSTVEELREKIAKCKVSRDMSYSNCFECAPHILSSIKPEEVASLN